MANCTLGWCEITLFAELQFAAVRGSEIIFKEYAFIKDKFVYNQNLIVGNPFKVGILKSSYRVPL